MQILIVPGIGNSGPEHWQSRWEALPERGCTRISPASWDEPDAEEWVGSVRYALGRLGPHTLVVAHSLGCLAVAHVASGSAPPFLGAVLVAPPDVAEPVFPVEAPTFVSLPSGTATVPTLVVASSDDAYCSPAAAAGLAARWGAELVDVGPRGHLNSASGLGDWPLGWLLVQGFAAALPALLG